MQAHNFNVLKHPRITEKATRLSESRVYCFDVALSANKALVMEAIKSLYKVTPRKVTFVNIPAKVVRGRKGGKGTTSRGKKAYVFLKEGDTIEFV